MSAYFEIVSFCPALPSQVDKIIDVLDPRKVVSYRLYKHHTLTIRSQASRNGRLSVKCLERIGRDMEEIILLDN